jgi:hypothetical protein
MSGLGTRSGKRTMGVFDMVIERVVSIVGWLAVHWNDLLMAGCAALIAVVMFSTMFL